MARQSTVLFGALLFSSLFLTARATAEDSAKKPAQPAKRVVVVKALAGGGTAQQAAAIARQFYSTSTTAVREKVDSNDPLERFLLLTPGGPLVVEVAMTIDGKPFRKAREKLIDEMLSAVKKDKDGKVAWKEALKSSRFTLGRVRITNEQQRKQYEKIFDGNKNGVVDRAEARRFIAQYYQGAAFTLTAGSGYRGGFGGGFVVVNGRYVSRGGGTADVHALLDENKDSVLSAEEIAAAGKRLKSRDADDNDLLYTSELSAASAPGNRINRTTTRQTSQLAILLGPTAKAETVFNALGQRYKNKEGVIAANSFSAIGNLFGMLDKNKNGKLDQNEVLALGKMKPHVAMSLDLAKAKGAKGFSLKFAASQLTVSKKSRETVGVELPGIKIAFVANLNPVRTYNYSATAKRYLQLYDKDKNGYLDKKELAGNLARQFAIWDGDGDGKIFEKEITASYNRRLAPQSSQIRAIAATQGNSLFQALDVSGDGRLSLREMRTAHQRIKTFDENKDNRITRDEIPVTYTVSFGLGNAGYRRFTQPRSRTGARTAATTNSDAPQWFTRMDRNGDGDITFKEFLGDKQAFEKLDANHDGFIEPKEAKAAKKE